MPVDCDGYVVNPSNNQWSHKARGSAAFKSKAYQHAERVAWGKLPDADAYLLVQNAYPCSECHAYFKGQSLNRHAIIIKVEANEGSYSAEHFQNASGRPIHKGSVPCVIYYFKGVASYVTISDVMAFRSGDPPAEFPPIPDIP